MQITPDKLQFLLTINSISVDITNNVVNWEDVKIDYTRDDLKGVYIDVTNSIDFDGEAYNLLSNLYETYSFNANAIFVINLRNDVLDGTNTLWTYTELKRVDLDFSTFKKTDYIISLNAKSNSLADLIKANKSTVYDIPISELTKSDFNYDRLEMANILDVIPVTSDYLIQTENINEYVFSLSEGHLEFGHNAYIIPFSNSGSSEINDANIVYLDDNDFISIKKTTKAYITTSFDVTFDKVYSNCYIGVGFIKGNIKNAITAIKLDTVSSHLGPYTHTFTLDKTLIDTTDDCKLILWFQNAMNTITATIKNVNIKVDYNSRGEKVIFDVVDPSILLSKLINKIAGTGYTATINTGLTNDIRLASAESIRGFATPKFHTSFEQFYNSMRAVFGLEYDISGTNINFKTRENIFKNTKSINIEDITDLSLSVNNSHIYSSLKIGFKKTDYNKVNGKDEFRFTNEYSTGVTVSSKKLELISDYRADAWGIEFLTQRRGEDTTDNDSDNDIFFVDCGHLGDPIYILVPNRAIPITGVISPTTMFNVIFSPRQCLLRNASYLGVSSNLYRFASSEGLSSVIIDSVYENSNVTINNKLFLPDLLEFKVGEISALPAEKDGYVEFIYNGITYQGYIKELNHFIGKDQETTWTLFRKQ